jgi:outer membrane lipoprotein-sorting protein
MKRTIFIHACLFVIVGFSYAQKAESILEKALAAYDNSNGIHALFAVNMRVDKQAGSESFEATIDMKGEKFRLITPDIHTWCDGQTLWTYLVRANEVNITHPSDEDVQTLNPVMLLRQYKKDYKPAYIGESTSDLGKPASDVKLVSKNNNEIETVDLQIDRATSLPIRISVAMKHGIFSTVRISKIQTAVNQPESLFVFNAANYPGVLEVDLR